MADAPKILLIDDERELVSGLTLRLRSAGYNVHACYDGVTGLQAAATVQPSLILVDVQMPGLDGITVLGELKKNPRTSDIPVIMLSACVVDRSCQASLALGARRYLEKPFQAEKLLDAIRSELNG